MVTLVFHMIISISLIWGYDFPYGYISVYDIENGKETRFREDMREVYNQIRYIPSRQLYFIDGFPANRTKGQVKRIGTSIFGLIWTTEHLNKHSVIWTMQIFCIVNI